MRALNCGLWCMCVGQSAHETEGPAIGALANAKAVWASMYAMKVRSQSSLYYPVMLRRNSGL